MRSCLRTKQASKNISTEHSPHSPAAQSFYSSQPTWSSAASLVAMNANLGGRPAALESTAFLLVNDAISGTWFRMGASGIRVFGLRIMRGRPRAEQLERVGAGYGSRVEDLPGVYARRDPSVFEPWVPAPAHHSPSQTRTAHLVRL